MMYIVHTYNCTTIIKNCNVFVYIRHYRFVTRVKENVKYEISSVLYAFDVKKSSFVMHHFFFHKTTFLIQSQIEIIII